MEDHERTRALGGRVAACVGGALAACAFAVAAVAGCASAGTVTVSTTVHTAPTAPTTASTPTTSSSPTTATTATAVETTETTTQPVTTTDGTPVGFPTPEEKALLDRLEAQTRSRCTRTREKDRAAGASASLNCDLSDIYNVTTFFEAFPTVRDMRLTYADARKTQGIDVDTGLCTRQGKRPPGETTWNTGKGTGTRGRVACFRAPNGRFWFVWTQEDVKVVAWASSPLLPSVRRYWLNHSAIEP